MRSGLFRRLFAGILVVVLSAVFMCSITLLLSERYAQQENFETEVLLQARQVADYLHEMSQLRFVRGNSTLQRLVRKKINYIYDHYNADIWLVSFNDGHVEYIDSSWNTSSMINSEQALEQLSRISEGNEIRVDGLFPELGNIVTIGVPWTYQNDYVVGAVLLHIPPEELHISFWQVLPSAALPAAISILLGVLLAFLIARSQTLPLREIDAAVRAFSTGDLTRRIELNCGGELQELGDSINRMAADLAELEDSRRAFVANVSHELRSPMTSIKGYLQAMLDGTIPPEDAPKYMQIVLSETDRLSDLVRDLLDLSRLESGRFPMSLAPFDANELMRQILISFEGRIEEKGIDVHIELEADPCYAVGDASRIHQVVRNFIDNAIKYATVPQPVLTVRTECFGREVRFTVCDNGPGIAPEDQPHILDRFYKADKAHSAGNGTGLGLSICKTILQQHASRVEFSSVPGSTAFGFRLPAAEPPARSRNVLPVETATPAPLPADPTDDAAHKQNETS